MERLTREPGIENNEETNREPTPQGASFEWDDFLNYQFGEILNHVELGHALSYKPGEQSLDDPGDSLECYVV